MKKLILAAVLLLPMSASAELVKGSLWGGYTNVCMADFKDSIIAQPGTVDVKGSGWIVGGDINIVAAPFFMYGVRVEILQAEILDQVSGGNKTSYRGSLVPLMGGLNFKFEIPATDIGFIAGIHGGYGLASFDVDSGTAGIVTNTGGGFLGEVSGGMEFGVAPLVALRVMAGYRYAPVDAIGASITNLDFSGINAVGGISIGF